MKYNKLVRNDKEFLESVKELPKGSTILFIEDIKQKEDDG